MVRSAAFVLMALLVTLSGCGMRYSSATPKLILWQMEDASVMPFIDSVISAFEKEYDGKISVEQVHYDPEDIHQQFLTAAIAGAGPDLLLAPGDKAGIFSVGKFIYPVDELIDTGAYVRVALDAVADGGKLWGVPASTGNHLMLFRNKKLAARAPVDTDELLEMCAGIKTSGPAGAFCFATNIAEPFFFIPWLSGFGGWPIDQLGPSLDTPEMRRALSFVKELKDERGIMPRECDYNCMDGLFKEGRVAFIENGDWAIDGYRKQLGEDFAISALPVMSATHKPMRPMVSGRYFMINSVIAGDRLKWALRFIEFYTNAGNQSIQFEKLGRLPGLLSAFRDARAKSPEYLKPVFAALESGAPAPIQVEMRAVWDAMRSQLGAYFTGRKELGAATASMQADADRRIKEMRVR